MVSVTSIGSAAVIVIPNVLVTVTVIVAISFIYRYRRFYHYSYLSVNSPAPRAILTPVFILTPRALLLSWQ